MAQLIIGIVAGMGAGFVLGQRAARRSTAAAPAPPTPTPTPPPLPPSQPATGAEPSPPVPSAMPVPPLPQAPAPTPVPPPTAAVAPLPPPALAPDTLPPAPNQPASAKPRRPNKRAAKLGLTEDDFKPADDILERMQKAWELGVPLEDLDAALAAQSGTPSQSAAATAPTTDAEREERLRRVLGRLDGGGAE